MSPLLVVQGRLVGPETVSARVTKAGSAACIYIFCMHTIGFSKAITERKGETYCIKLKHLLTHGCTLSPPIGFLIYFAYGIRHSLEGNPRDEDDDEDVYSDSINAATEEKSAMQANDRHQRSLSLPFILHEKTSEC